MLPDFPKLKAEVHRDILAKIQRKVRQSDSVLAEIKTFTQHEGRDMRYERIDAPPVQNGPEEMGAMFQVSLVDLPDLVGPKLDAKLDEIAHEIAKQQAGMFFRKTAETSNEVGNAFDAGGKPLSAELLLDMLSKVQTDFEPDGSPSGKIVIHPDMVPALKKAAEELERDPELKRRHEDILRRQREEWATRESHRKLVD
jgi:hypothetical protein